MIPISIVIGLIYDKKIQDDEKMKTMMKNSENLLNTIGEGIIELDRDFKIFSVNDYALKLTKRSREEVLGRKCYQIFHNLGKICPNCAVEATFKNGQPAHGYFEWINKDEEILYVEINSYPVYDSNGKIERVIETIKDLSASLEAKKELDNKEVLEKIAKMAFAREVKMVELKNKIKELESQVTISERDK